MTSSIPKDIFIQEVDRLFQMNEVAVEARGYLYSLKQQKERKVSSTKSSGRAELAHQVILEALKMSANPINRETIVELTGTHLSPNSISAYAAQLIASGQVKKSSQKYAKGRTQVVYSLA